VAVMTKERINEIKNLYTKKYPHLEGIKDDRQFFVNATRLDTPDGISALELYQIITDYNL